MSTAPIVSVILATYNRSRAGEREANRYKVGRALPSLVVRPVCAAAISLGIHPYAPFFALRFGRRGNLVNALRRQTGLGKLTR